MLWFVKQLLTPCKYLLIKEGKSSLQSKAMYDYYLPILFSILTVLVTYALGQPAVIHKHPGLAKSLQDLLALLIAFYMAALAAVATFDRPGIDDVLDGEGASLKFWNNDENDYVDVELTYRQFISYLFGYLSFASLILFGLLIFFTKAWPIIENKTHGALIRPDLVFVAVDLIIFCVVFFLLWQLIFTSLLGIYFLSERLQTLGKGGK
ncbi:MAG: hypothetical protein ACTHLA_01465 [Asticcacaulis sp.]|uniref:hypothetical protein n=1 Tax=Asticcacaulis sp. TaxID=1872648 RepID=UPI003F7B7321